MRSRKYPPDRPRVFNLGLNKTGTSSFHEAMTILGLRSLHYGGHEVAGLVRKAVAEDRPLLTYLHPKYDAFSDITPLSTRFGRLDRQYPGSRFVLTVRPLEEWLDSRRRHVEHNQRASAAGAYRGRYVVVDEAKWRAQWERHLEKVRGYFDGRPDFLEVDLTDDPRWEPLCTLLGVPEPAVPFPWANRDESLDDRE
jgi:hypothetical protein